MMIDDSKALDISPVDSRHLKRSPSAAPRLPHALATTTHQSDIPVGFASTSATATMLDVPEEQIQTWALENPGHTCLIGNVPHVRWEIAERELRPRKQQSSIKSKPKTIEKQKPKPIQQPQPVATEKKRPQKSKKQRFWVQLPNGKTVDTREAANILGDRHSVVRNFIRNGLNNGSLKEVRDNVVRIGDLAAFMGLEFYGTVVNAPMNNAIKKTPIPSFKEMYLQPKTVGILERSKKPAPYLQSVQAKNPYAYGPDGQIKAPEKAFAAMLKKLSELDDINLDRPMSDAELKEWSQLRNNLRAIDKDAFQAYVSKQKE